MVISLFFGFNLTKFMGLVLIVWLMHFFLVEGLNAFYLWAFVELKTKIRDTNRRGGEEVEDILANLQKYNFPLYIFIF
jgi:hypothetical protein